MEIFSDTLLFRNQSSILIWCSVIIIYLKNLINCNQVIFPNDVPGGPQTEKNCPQTIVKKIHNISIILLKYLWFKTTFDALTHPDVTGFPSAYC